MSDCEHIKSCCDPDPFSYSLVNYPVVTNEELTFFIPCPDGFTCLYEMYEVTIPAGEIEYRPTTPDEDTTAKIQEIAESRARARGYAAMQPTPKTYQSDAITVSCGEGAIGDLVVGTNPFITSSTSVTIPAGMFSSSVSKVSANAQATAEAMVAFAGANCHWENTEQTVTCPESEPYGGPFTVAAGTYESTVSQEAADEQARLVAQAEADANCTADPCSDAGGDFGWGDGIDCDLSEPDNTLYGTMVTPDVSAGATYTPVDSPNLAIDIGTYRVDYTTGYWEVVGAGAFRFTVNPRTAIQNSPFTCESTSAGTLFITGLITHVIDPSLPTGLPYWTSGVDAQNAYLASYPGGSQFTTDDPGDIQLQFRAQGTCAYWPAIGTYANGVANPTFTITRIEKPKFTPPVRVRIKDWDTVKAQLVPCVVCDASADPEWDGTLTDTIFSFGGDFYQYQDESVGLSIGGKTFSSAYCFTSGSVLTTSGCGWVVQIVCLQGASNRKIWQGVKVSGGPDHNSPIGVYCWYDELGSDPCSATPPAIEIESY